MAERVLLSLDFRKRFFKYRLGTVEKSGSPSTVVWNPWVEKAKVLGDLPDDGYKDFVSVQTAIENSKAVTVEPRGSSVFSTQVSVGH